MRRHRLQAVERVIEAAELLGDLAEEVVFTGGAAVGLLITDPAVPAVRPTLDIDVIAEVATLAEYYRLQERLRAKGFTESMEDKVICRWRHGSIILDVMPTDEKILGFANRWYIEAVRQAKGDIQAYLAAELGRLLANRDFLDSLPGHLPGDAASQQRVPIILERMRDIAG